MILSPRDSRRTVATTDAPGDGRSADFRLIAADHQHFAERDFVLVGTAEDVALDAQKLAFGNAILLSTGTDDGVHETSEKWDPPCTTGERTRQNFVDKTLIPFWSRGYQPQLPAPLHLPLCRTGRHCLSDSILGGTCNKAHGGILNMKIQNLEQQGCFSRGFR